MPANTMTKLLIVAAWASIGFIAYATLTHIRFVYAIYFALAPMLFRPEMQTFAHFEHVIAFAVFGALFCFAYSRNILFVCCAVLGSSILLEFLQTLTPDRHGTLIDAAEKMAGGAAGIVVAKIILAIVQRRRRWVH
jgi:VanZ family protein